MAEVWSTIWARLAEGTTLAGTVTYDSRAQGHRLVKRVNHHAGAHIRELTRYAEKCVVVPLEILEHIAVEKPDARKCRRDHS